MKIILDVLPSTLGQKKYVCFPFLPVKIFGRVGRYFRVYMYDIQHTVYIKASYNLAKTQVI